ncbi:DUF1559 domain-containing protein [uncultured Gimesia sp.]|uniref:DUF1559 family PulG-like putative transporter n=1 Tax=uncultured Gimesia sp. TaxID=1678688 RepID=UPI0030D9E26F|tara:strand:+ start:121937 stop:123046 length:1110 start_codon:yes stop_codon:yes gene_type:complete
MENESTELPTKKNRVKIFLVSGSILILFICGLAFVLFLACLGVGYPIQILFYTFAGWYLFLTRVISQITMPVSSLVSAFVLVAIMAVVIQLLGVYAIRRLRQQNKTAVPTNWRFRWTCAVLVLLTISFAGGFAVVGVAHQSAWLMTSDESLIRNSSEARSRGQSRSNLKQIGLALYNYHDSHQQLPVGGSFSQVGQPQYSWATSVLPYLDQGPLYHQIDFNQAWNAEPNRKVFETRLSILENPGLDYAFDNGKSKEENAKGYQPSHYAANSRVLNVNSGLVLEEITDGTSNTIMAGEIKSGIKPWGDPTNFRDPALGINKSPRGFESPFRGGAHVLMGDGRVRFVNENIDPELLKALSTPNGGEPVGNF